MTGLLFLLRMICFRNLSVSMRYVSSVQHTIYSRGLVS